MFYENNGPSKHTSHSMIYAPISPRRAPFPCQPFYLTNHVFYENNGQSKHTSHSMTYVWISPWARSKADTSNSLSERKIIRWARVYSLLVDGIFSTRGICLTRRLSFKVYLIQFLTEQVSETFSMDLTVILWIYLALFISFAALKISFKDSSHGVLCSVCLESHLTNSWPLMVHNFNVFLLIFFDNLKARS